MSKQNWSVGSLVKVGFMQLTVTDVVVCQSGKTAYFLVSAKGQKYEFDTYAGLHRIES